MATQSLTGGCHCGAVAYSVELDLAILEETADFYLPFLPIPEFPAMDRDLNFVLDEAVSWQELEEVVRRSAGPLLQAVEFDSQYRGQQIPANKKSYNLRLYFRAADRTLTNEELDVVQRTVVAACSEKLAAALR